MPALTNPNLATDANGRDLAAMIEVSTYVLNVVLAADTHQVISLPASARKVVFSANGDFWAKFGGAAVIPVGSVTDGTGSVLNPSARAVNVATAGSSTVGLISALGCAMSIEVWA